MCRGCGEGEGEGGRGGWGDVGGQVADLLASILVSISQPLIVLWFLVLCGAGKQESHLFLFSRAFILRTSPFPPPPSGLDCCHSSLASYL